jgi:very-short-patch-repair endonuclease
MAIGECEATFLLILRSDESLPPFVVHHLWDAPRSRRHVDAAFCDYGVAVEIQEETAHRHWTKQTEDAQKLNDLQLAGWIVLHFTGTMLRDPAAVLATVRAALGV